jgi:pyruvate dehydrogenase E2 component (dihydrolipoamide acetyltransferase)
VTWSSARSGSLRSSELSDASLTVTQLGDQSVDSVLGGSILRRWPWVEGGRLCVMPTVVASLAADHRVSDGNYGARFLAEVRRLLQAPDSL